MHKIHLHFRLPYTDVNFGNIFSIWDRILGTYLVIDREKIIYGVDIFYDEKVSGKISNLLKEPFEPYSKSPMVPKN